MTNKEMIYILKNKIYSVFTNIYLNNETSDPNLDYLKIRNLLLKLIDADTYDYSTATFVHYYDFNDPVILKEAVDSKEIVSQDILKKSMFIVQNLINELIVHTTYYPEDIKAIFVNFLNQSEEAMLELLAKYSKEDTKLLAKVI